MCVVRLNLIENCTKVKQSYENYWNNSNLNEDLRTNLNKSDEINTIIKGSMHKEMLSFDYT